MKKIYFTITGLNFYYGWEFLKENMVVNLEKEPDNKYDREAIAVKLEGFGKIGYVANSTKAVIGESMSAGRLYDKFKKRAKGKVLFASERGVICRFKG